MSPMFRRGPRRPVTAVDFERYDDLAKRALVLANIYAVDSQQPQMGTEHLACTFVTPPIREHLGLVPTIEDVGRALTERGYHLGTTTTGPVSETGMAMRPFAKEVKAIITQSFAVADAAGQQEVGCEHLLGALLDRPKSSGARVLLDLGVDPEAIRARNTDEGPATTAT